LDSILIRIPRGSFAQHCGVGNVRDHIKVLFDILLKLLLWVLLVFFIIISSSTCTRLRQSLSGWIRSLVRAGWRKDGH
jgi:hypothetical protein